MLLYIYVRVVSVSIRCCDISIFELWL